MNHRAFESKNVIPVLQNVLSKREVYVCDSVATTLFPDSNQYFCNIPDVNQLFYVNKKLCDDLEFLNYSAIGYCSQSYSWYYNNSLYSADVASINTYIFCSVHHSHICGIYDGCGSFYLFWSISLNAPLYV